MQIDAGVDLTYCTNIHPGNGWPEVLENIQRYAPELKRRLSPDAPFGLGLRLSDEESRQLAQPAALEEFARWLAENGFYVRLINGFPFGSFHREKVKDDVFAPDWRSGARMDYTLRLTEILRHLMPEGSDAGVSTIPLSYKRWEDAGEGSAWFEIAQNIAMAASVMHRIRVTENKTIHLDIEPEPDGLVENSEELAAFFTEWLIPEGGAQLSRDLGVSAEEARAILKEHVRVCFDTCHSAVEYETAEESLDRYEEAGMRIGRVQLSSALQVTLNGGREQAGHDLEAFADSTYLHQVIERQADGGLRQYADLPDALPHIGNAEAREWRIHFHVPIFVESYGSFGSTQPQLRAALELMKRRRFSAHLEIETYTWDVLPPALKQDLGEMIAGEYEWVLKAWAE